MASQNCQSVLFKPYFGFEVVEGLLISDLQPLKYESSFVGFVGLVLVFFFNDFMCVGSLLVDLDAECKVEKWSAFSGLDTTGKISLEKITHTPILN